MNKRCVNRNVDPEYEKYCELFKLYETLALYFVKTEFIPIQNHVPYFERDKDKDLHNFYVQKWKELEEVIEELSNCKYVHYKSPRTTTQVVITYRNKETTKEFDLVQGEHGALPANVFEIVKTETRLVEHPLTRVDFRKQLHANLLEQ
jgi:hypothetical protein